MSAMDACPFATAKDMGAHHLSFVLPPDVDHDVLVICDRCGDHQRIAIQTIAPDDLTPEEIRQMAQRR